MPLPLVSICIPTYLGAEFISETISSVISQSYKNLELIIVDDKSPDNTREVISKIDDPRIKYYRNSKNLGPEANWNRCLEKAKGKYYKLLPHDDLLFNDSIRKQVEVLEDDVNKNIALVFGARQIINSSGNKLFLRRPLGKKNKKIVSNKLVNKCVRAGGNIIGEPGNGLIRSELINKVGKYDAKYPYMIDLNYWFRVLQYGDAYYLADHLSKFRISNNSWSAKIGVAQSNDFYGCIKFFRSSKIHNISRISVFIGLLNSKILSYARRFVFKCFS